MILLFWDYLLNSCHCVIIETLRRQLKQASEFVSHPRYVMYPRPYLTCSTHTHTGLVLCLPTDEMHAGHTPHTHTHAQCPTATGSNCNHIPKKPTNPHTPRLPGLTRFQAREASLVSRNQTILRKARAWFGS